MGGIYLTNKGYRIGKMAMPAITANRLIAKKNLLNDDNHPLMSDIAIILFSFDVCKQKRVPRRCETLNPIENMNKKERHKPLF